MSPILISDVRIFDGLSVVHDAGSVLIDSGKIISVTENVPSVLPENTHVISAHGKTILPGLIDAHVHAGSDPEDLKQPLRFGVTTVLDMHNEPQAVAMLTQAAKSSSAMSSFKSACHAATIEGGWPAPIYEMDQGKSHHHNHHTWSHISTSEDVEDFVRKNISDGCSYIKLMHESGTNFSLPLPTPTRALQLAVVQAAHHHNLLAVGHATSAADAIFLLEVGVDGLMHIPHDIPPTPDLLHPFVKSGAFLTPTLAAYTSGTGSNASTHTLLANPKVLEKLDDRSKQNLNGALAFEGYQGTMECAYQWVVALKENGVDLVCGTDASPRVPGTSMGASLHHELGIYVSECGFSPVEALRSATAVAARRFGLVDRGRIASGLRADLVLCNGDPTTDITQLLDVEEVWKEGVPTR